MALTRVGVGGPAAAYVPFPFAPKDQGRVLEACRLVTVTVSPRLTTRPLTPRLTTTRYCHDEDPAP